MSVRHRESRIRYGFQARKGVYCNNPWEGLAGIVTPLHSYRVPNGARPIYYCKDCEHPFDEPVEHLEGDESVLVCPWCESDNYRDMAAVADSREDV